MAGDKKEDKDEEIVIVTDDPRDLDSSDGVNDEPAQPAKSEDAEDESDDEEDFADARLGKSEDDEEEEDARKRERKSRKQRQREARERMERELRFMERRNAQLERQIQDIARRQDEAEIGAIEAKIAAHKAAIAKADRVIADAVEQKRGADVAEATRIRDNLVHSLRKLEEDREEETARPFARREEQPVLDPQVIRRAKGWVSKNPWFDPKRRDEDSAIAGLIDDRLQAEGYDPATDEYWQELDRRVAKRLPHLKKGAARSDDDDDELEPKKKNGAAGGPKFRAGGRDRKLGKNEVYLSKERIDAMKEAGIWDDPVSRAKMIKRYAEFDRALKENT